MSDDTPEATAPHSPAPVPQTRLKWSRPQLVHVQIVDQTFAEFGVGSDAEADANTAS